MRSHDASSILGLVCSRRCTSAGQQAIASLYDAGRRRYRVKNSTASAQQRRRRGRGADPIGPDPAGIQSYSEKPQKDKSMCHYGNIRRILVAHAATAAHRGPSVHRSVRVFTRNTRAPTWSRVLCSTLFYLQVDVWDTKYAVESVYCLSYMCPAGSWLPNMCIAAAWLLLRGPRPLARVSDCLSAPRIRGLRALDNPARSIP